MKNKKVYSEKELEQKALAAFAQYPNAKQVYATSDGNVFLEKNRASLHAGKGSIVTFDRPIKEEEEKDNAPKTLKAEEVIKAIKEAQNLEALDAFRSDERATVKKALEAKEKEFNQQ